MKKVLFVCLGNICRSPAAEAVFQSFVDQAGLGDSIACDSAGTSGYHDGEKADPRMIDHGSRRGYDLTSISRKVRSQDFHDFDYVIAMDQSNLSNLKKVRPSDGKADLHLMCEFAENRTEKEVPDPYFGGADGFEHVFDILEDACHGLLNHIKNS